MRTDKIILLLLIYKILLSCSNKDLSTKEELTSVDTIAYEINIIQEDPKMSIELTIEEMDVLKKVLINEVEKYNSEEEIRYEKWGYENENIPFDVDYLKINLNDYRCFYFPSLINETDKIVEIFGSCDKNEIEPIFVKDGGKCYFSLKYNLTKKELIYFGVNGLA